MKISIQLGDDELLDTFEAAEFLRKPLGKLAPSEGTLRRLRAIGGGPIFRKFGPKWGRYQKRDLINWVESRLSKPLTSTGEAAYAEASELGFGLAARGPPRLAGGHWAPLRCHRPHEAAWALCARGFPRRESRKYFLPHARFSA
jgi:hypothetical protein